MPPRRGGIPTFQARNANAGARDVHPGEVVLAGVALCGLRPGLGRDAGTHPIRPLHTSELRLHPCVKGTLNPVPYTADRKP